MNFKEWILNELDRSRFQVALPDYKTYSTSQIMDLIKQNQRQLQQARNLEDLSTQLNNILNKNGITFSVSHNPSISGKPDSNGNIFQQGTVDPTKPRQVNLVISNDTLNAFKKWNLQAIKNSYRFMLSHEFAHDQQFHPSQGVSSKSIEKLRPGQSQEPTPTMQALGARNDDELNQRWTDIQNFKEHPEKPPPNWLIQLAQQRKTTPQAILADVEDKAQNDYYNNSSEFPAHAQSAVMELLNAINTGQLKVQQGKQAFIKYIDGIHPGNIMNLIPYSSEVKDYYNRLQKNPKLLSQFIQLMKTTAYRMPDSEYL